MHERLTIIGIDLSGPRNVADTSVAVFTQQGGQLCFLQAIHGAGDKEIFDLVAKIGEKGCAAVGIDAPLSYNPGGGDRPSDTNLRRCVLRVGRAGVMPPTLIRMVYLTLRGIALTRALEALKPRVDLKLVEVHPGACMLLRGAPASDVAAFKRGAASRLRLLEWLQASGMNDLPKAENTFDHFVAACAAALASWKWATGESVWCHPAQPPEHPYDFAC